MIRSIASILIFVQLSISVSAVNKNDDELISKAIQKSHLRDKGSKPVTLLAHFHVQLDKKAIDGTYTEYWISPDKWRKEILSADYSYIHLRLPDKEWNSAVSIPREILSVGALLEDDHSEFGEFWRTTGKWKMAVPNSPLQCIQVVSKISISTSTPPHFYCLDISEDILRARISSKGKGVKRVAEFSQQEPFEGKQFPRLITSSDDGKQIIQIWVDKLSSEPIDELHFAPLTGVDPWPTCEKPTPSMPIATPDPTPDPSYPDHRIKHATVVLAGTIGVDEKLSDLRVEESVNSQFDKAALEVVKLWRFRPALCGNSPVPTRINVEVNFNIR